jgi:glutathionylspermidine synthase
MTAIAAHTVAAGKYHHHRKQIYEPIRDTFSWDYWDGQEYALASYVTVDQAIRNEIQVATKQLGDLFAKVAEVVRMGSVALWEELGLPPETWAAIQLSTNYQAITAIGRFDFAYTDQGLKMIEFNSDTPTCIVEAFFVNGKVCNYYQAEDINAGTELDFQHMFHELLGNYRAHGYRTDHIAFCCDAGDEEDRGTTKYLLQQSGLPGFYTPISQLAYDPSNERLTAMMPNGVFQPIDVLYRLHALEIIAKDKTSKGFPIGPKLLELAAKKRIAFINPPSAFITQTKALQALIWNLYESHIFFSAEEREVIATYCLPTYLENQFHGKESYVRKPFFGREGGAVSLYHADGTLEETDQATFYWDQPMVYQKKVDLPILTVETAKGPYTGKLLFGSFFIGGKPSAVLGRIGQAITQDLTYYLPLAVK